MVEIADNLRETVIAAFGAQAGEISELGLEILCALLGLVSLVDQVGIITGAFFVVANFLGLDAICTVRLLAVALDLSPPAH